MNWDFYEDTLVRLFESAIDREIEVLQQERVTTMSNTNSTSTTETTAPKFKVGDRLMRRTNRDVIGVVEQIIPHYRYILQEEQDGEQAFLWESDLEYAKLTAEDAWLEVALMVGRTVEECELHKDTYNFCVLEEKEIRHRAYQILGGNGIKVTEDVKARVRALIERAKRV